MLDLTTRGRVEDALLQTIGAEAAHVGVTVDAGIVTLTGPAPDFATKLTALRAAARAQGVLGVVDQLTVRAPGGRARDDATLVRHCQEALAALPDGRGDTLRPCLDRGWVTLMGETTDARAVDAATAAVLAVPGVVGVTEDCRPAFPAPAGLAAAGGGLALAAC